MTKFEALWAHDAVYAVYMNFKALHESENT